MTAPFEILNVQGRGKAVLLCEHACACIPDHLNDLGVSAQDRFSHAAWDPGARELTRKLSQALDAPAVMSTVSRLVYDCNRPPEAPSAMPEKSEVIEVPGNVGLTPEDRAERTKMVYEPFCQAVSGVLDGRDADTVVITVHSFTPIYFGKKRSVELGLLHDTDSRLVDAMLEQPKAFNGFNVARNEPYGPADGVTHSLKLHALPRGMANVMIEVRNDLIDTLDQIQHMADTLAPVLQNSIATLTHEAPK